ncbi:MAG TPA: RNA methyltransferase [Bacteroidia bacterium]|nr:RNA methyltransferase [Bacteroidia bacterium]
MAAETDQELYEYLAQFITENKRSKIEEIVQWRTRYLTLVLEDIYQPHNASAVLRTCECFGIQDVHIIENRNKYTVNPDVVMGSTKWMDLHKYNGSPNNTPAALKALKDQGYRIVATTPHKNDCNITDLDLSKGKVALVLGTEIDGITDTVFEMADEFVKIPMYGFTESFNISVTAAMCLHTLSDKLRNSELNWRLSDEEHLKLKTDWVRNILTKPELVEAEFWKKMKEEGRI